MSRPFITPDGIDVAGLLVGDRFIDRIEYKGSELFTAADGTALQTNIEANTQLIYDTSGILQVQIDDAVALVDPLNVEGSEFILLDTGDYSSYESRYSVPDTVDQLIIDTDNAGAEFYIEIPATRTKRLRINHTYDDDDIYIFSELDNWSRGTRKLTHTTSGRDFVRFGGETSFDLVPSESGGSGAELSVQGAVFGSLLSDFSASYTINNKPIMIQKVGENAFARRDAWFLTPEQYNGIVVGTVGQNHVFNSDSQTLAISSVYKVSDGRIQRIDNKYNYISCTLNMPASPSLGDAYILNHPNGGAVTIQGNGNNFAGFKTGTNFSINNESLAIRYDGSDWQVEDYYNEAWGNLGIGLGGTFYGDVHLNNAELHAWTGSEAGADSNLTIGHNTSNPGMTGINNTYLGTAVGKGTTGGNSNTIAGRGAFYFNSTGSSNTGIGDLVLEKNTGGNYNTAIGHEALQENTVGSGNIGIGFRAAEAKQIGTYNIAVGYGAMTGFAGTTGTYQSDENIAIGHGALERIRTGDYNIAIGRYALDGNGTAYQDKHYSVAIGDSAGRAGLGSANVVIGNQAGVSIGVNSDYNVLVGAGAYGVVGANEMVAIGHNANTAAYGVAIGYLATTGTAQNTVAIGRSASAAASYTIAIGYGAGASSTDGISIGRDSSGISESIAIGHGAQATANQGIAIGTQARANTTSIGIAIGSNAQANNQGVIAIGFNNLGTNTSSIAIGRDSTTDGYAAMCMGNENSITGSYAVGMGFRITTNGRSAIAMGEEAVANADYTIAMGQDATAATQDSIVMGRGASSSVSNWGIALGNNASAANESCIAMGYNSNAFGIRSIAIGSTADSTGSHAVAIGYGASSFGGQSVAVGQQANSSGALTVAVGYLAEATSPYAVAYGLDAAATGNYSLSFGSYSVASLSGSIAIGGSASIANQVSASAQYAVAIGYNIESVHENAVVFGKDATSQFVDTFHIGDTSTPMDLYVSGSLIAAIKEQWSIVSTGFTAAANGRYFVDATAAMNIDMAQSPTIGDAVWIDDYKSQSGTNNITVRAFGGGTLLVEGVSENLVIDVAGALIKLIYVDATFGWRYKVV